MLAVTDPPPRSPNDDEMAILRRVLRLLRRCFRGWRKVIREQIEVKQHVVSRLAPADDDPRTT
jgi:hypothetical protein